MKIFPDFTFIFENNFYILAILRYFYCAKRKTVIEIKPIDNLTLHCTMMVFYSKNNVSQIRAEPSWLFVDSIVECVKFTNKKLLSFPSVKRIHRPHFF